MWIKKLAIGVMVSGTVLLSACDASSLGIAPVATPTTAPVLIGSPTPVPPTPEMTAEQIAERLRSSTVMIRADFPATVVDDAGRGSGTGIVLSADGYIVTNAHVVEGASAVTIALAGSNSERPARIVGRSACDDLAVLKVDNTDGLTPATFGQSSTLKVGERVYALGYPRSDLTGVDLSITQGIVSKHELALDEYPSLIQTDAAINPGNSGGPLVNSHGEVIGINTLSTNAAYATSMNFAISIDAATPVIKELRTGTNRQWLGLNLVANTYEKHFGTNQGIVVAAVDSGSPAAKAGIEPAALLFNLEGSDVNSTADVCKILRSHSDGDQLKMSLLYQTSKGGFMQKGEIVMGKPELVDKEFDLFPIDQPTPTPEAQAPTPEPQAAYADDFSSNTGAWDTKSTSSIEKAISNGAYHITINAEGSYFLSAPKQVDSISNSIVASDILVRGNARAGIALRYSEHGDTQSYVTCWVDSGNQYGCFVSVNDQWTTLAEATPSNTIRPGQANRVALAAIDQQVTLIINGQKVASFTTSNVAPGTPALYVENFDSQAGASFDNVAMYLP